jgi:glycosyltransferase involved in cell wall biosynthesis
MVGRRRPSRVSADIAGVQGLSSIWANSEYTQASVKRIYGSSGTEVVYPFVRFPERTPSRPGKSATGLRILSVTRLEWVKNLDTLLEGFALYRRRDAGASLELVGTGPARAVLETLARKLGIERALRFHGFLSDAELDRLSASCDAFACLPLDEPFGMIFPEAIARGLLLLGPDHGGPVEILEHGKLGELAAPLEPEAIAEGLARIGSLSDAAASERRAAADRSCRARFSERAGDERLRSLLRRNGIALGA